MKDTETDSPKSDCRLPFAEEFATKAAMRRTTLVILFFSAVVCFSHIWQGHLSGDAIRYAQISKNIVASGNWLQLNDPVDHVDSYSNKPHLLFWISAVNLKLFNFSTFTAKLPSAAFVFISLLLLMTIVYELCDQRTAVFAVLLFVGHRAFTRDILDLNVEGIATCGGFLIILSVLRLLKPNRSKYFLDGTTFGIGLLLLCQSKPPYLLFALLPCALTILLERNHRALILKPALWLGIAPWVCLIAAWYLGLDRTYLSGSFDNQWVNPIRNNQSFLPNVRDWIVAFIISWAPLSLFGLHYLFSKLLASLPNSRWKLSANSNLLPTSNPTLIASERFLLFWLIPLIPIILLVDCRPRYILLPMLALSILAAHSAARLLTFLNKRLLESLTAIAAVTIVFLFLILQLPVHRVNQLVLATKLYLADQNDNPLSAMPVLCTEATKLRNSDGNAHTTELLLELELNRQFTVLTSAQLVEQSKLALAEQYLVDSSCLKSLNNKGVIFTELSEIAEAKLISFVTVQDSLTRR